MNADFKGEEVVRKTRDSTLNDGKTCMMCIGNGLSSHNTPLG